MKLSLLTLSALASQALAATQMVTVAPSGQLMFQPNTLNASVGDSVVFTVESQNGPHSITSSAFNTPCQPDGVISSGFLAGVGSTSNDKASSGGGGGGNGYRRAILERANAAAATTFTLTINDTQPIWLFCEQVGHCQAGMVMVINPPASGNATLAQFQSSAKSASATTTASAVTGGAVGSASSSAAATTSGAAGSSIDLKALNFGASFGAGALTLAGLVSSSLLFL